MSKKEIDKVLNAPDALRDLVQQGLSFSRLDQLYDQLRLVGAVMALKALVEEVFSGENEAAKVSAAKTLMDLKEAPERIVERLKAAPFAELNMEQLEHVVNRLTGGETDLSKLIEEAQELVPGLEENTIT